MTYSNEWVEEGYVHFNYRSSQKQNDEFVNGIFEFRIDGQVQQNITNEV